MQGFKEYINKSIELFVNDKKTINIALEPGAVSETVTVTSDAPIIQSTPTVGDVVENRKIVEIPLNNRNFLQLVTLVPGVTSDDTAESGVGLTSTTNIVIAGNRRNSTNYLVDGVSERRRRLEHNAAFDSNGRFDTGVQGHHFCPERGVRSRFGRGGKHHYSGRRARFSRQPV